MATKSTLNDYSALGGLFRDGALGVFLSTGLISTLVPNSIESLGKVKALNSFATLNLFSVVYFAFPIVIFTTYWLVRGSSLFLNEKYSELEAAKAKKNQEVLVTQFDWIRGILIFLKLIPIVRFIIDNNFYSAWGDTNFFLLGCYFVLLSIGQFFLVHYSNTKALDLVVVLGERKSKMLYRSFCLDGLIFFLDIILGLTLIVFSKPWIVYHSGFYFLCALAMILYAIGLWVYSIRNFPTEHFNIQDFVVTVTLVAGGLSFPTINRCGYEQLLIMIGVLFAVITSLWLWKNAKNTKNVIGALVPAVLIFLTIFLFTHFAIDSGITRSNVSLLKTRFQASRQVSINELFPLDTLTGVNYHKGNYIDTAKLNPRIQIAFNLHKENQFVELNLSSNSPSKSRSRKIRPTFYKEYENIKNENDIENTYAREKNLINKFSDAIYNAVIAINISNIRESLSSSREFEKASTLEKYLHPLDHAALNLDQQSKQKDRADSMIKVSENLLSLVLLKTNGENFKDSTLPYFNERAGKLIKTLGMLYKNSIELRHDSCSLQPALIILSTPLRQDKAKRNKDSIWMTRLVKFHKLYFELREIEYIKAYEGAQKVYRSYLLDSQRMGIWTFLVTALVLSLGSYFNNQSNNELSSDKRFEKGKALPLDTPKNVLFILMLAIIILLIPLMKPIEPQNIDPEKPYWMISLQNWYAPHFIRGLTEKDEARPNNYGYGNTKVENIIDFKILETALQELSHQTTESVHRVSKSINRLDSTMRNKDDQIINKP